MAQQESTSSKLISKLREVSRGTSSPLGFGRAQAAKTPGMILLASLPSNQGELAEVAVSAGADALICHLFDDARESRKDRDKDKDAEKETAKDVEKGSAVLVAASADAESPVGASTDEGLASPSGSAGEAAGEPTTGAAAPPAPRFGGFAEERDGIAGVVKAAGGKPVGVVIGSAGAVTLADLEELVKLGVDFVSAHPHRAPVGLLGIEALGHVARLDRDAPAAPLRGLNELGVDAFELTITRPESSLPELTIHDVANCRQAVEPIRRPVLLPTAGTIKPDDLKHLHDIGIEALVLTPEVLGETAETVQAKIAEYRTAIDKLGPPIGRGRGSEGRRVTLPKVSVPQQADEDDDGDDGEDDDDDE